MEKDQQYCPIARTAIIIGSRWTAQIVRELIDHGPRRFQDFADAIEGIGPTTLSSRLKMLEEAGIVERHFYDEHPPRAHYVLTEKGHRMKDIIGAMRNWGNLYR
ncbi:MAG: HxlR family transcriptional regulator [Alphaproteobacteria bacterium BRH_c36]|nr:MAG: HxlR family transcriptional regulator [Alphaproteobacteria bacterium BRH_c36]